MNIVVQKFGGSSVANIERIKHVATIVADEVRGGNKVAVILSAMSGVTDKLVSYSNQVSQLLTQESLAEYDSVIASGEQITSGLLALELQTNGIKARSFLGWQIPIKTDESFSKARIEEISSTNLLKAFDNSNVIVIAGFQGLHEDSCRITTMGRGGSDTTAVAIAAALKSKRCDIFTDVDGVYTTDPRICDKARRLEQVTYEEMLEMASSGAKVLQVRSVEMAMKHSVVVRVLSSFGSDRKGTLITSHEGNMEKRLITGITLNKNDAQITLLGVEDHPGVASEVFGLIAGRNINVDMIVQNISQDNKTTDITFTAPETDLQNILYLLEEAREKIQYRKIVTRSNVVKVSVIGVGMASNAGVAYKMFETMANNSINILVISTSEIKISILIEDHHAELAVRALHQCYGLDNA